MADTKSMTLAPPRDVCSGGTPVSAASSSADRQMVYALEPERCGRSGHGQVHLWLGLRVHTLSALRPSGPASQSVRGWT